MNTVGESYLSYFVQRRHSFQANVVFHLSTGIILYVWGSTRVGFAPRDLSIGARKNHVFQKTLFWTPTPLCSFELPPPPPDFLKGKVARLQSTQFKKFIPAAMQFFPMRQVLVLEISTKADKFV